MEQWRYNILTTHDIEFTYSNGDKAFSIENFTNLNFNSLFQDHPFPVSTPFCHLDETKHNNKLFDSITNIVNHVNNNGGFIITGWYKKVKLVNILTNIPVL